MKSAFSVCLAVLILTSLTAAAGDQTKTSDAKKKKAVSTEKAKKKPAPSSIEKESGFLTGSHIKQTIRRNGQITDGMSQLIVLDQDTVHRSGASTVRELLNRQGVH